MRHVLSGLLAALLIAAPVQAQVIVGGGGAAAQIPVGKSVVSSNGVLEAVVPVQTVTGTSKTFATGDLQLETRRTNSGVAMTDTFPAAAAAGMVNGARLTLVNADAAADDTVTAGSGTTIASGSSYVVPFGRSVSFVYDLPNTTWRPTFNSGTAALGPSSASANDVAAFGDTTGKRLIDSGLAVANILQAPNNLSDLTDATVALSNLGMGPTGVTAGSYTSMDATVDAYGRITAAANGSGGGGGAVASVTGGTNVVCSPTTGAVVCDSTSQINAKTGTSYTLLASDMGKLLTQSNLSASAWTLAQAGTTGFEYGKAFDVQNKSAGTLTITPTTSTINGAASLDIKQNFGCSIYSDGTNWQVGSCTATLPNGSSSVLGLSGVDGTSITATNGVYSVATAITVNAQTGTTYTIVSGDIRKLVTFSNTAPVAVTVPQAGTTGFETGKYFDVENLNYGLVTLTPTTSTVNGASSINLPRNTGCRLLSDGTNWQVFGCTAIGRMDVAVNFSGLPTASQKFTFIADRAFNLPASLTNSRAVIGTNPSGTLTVTLNKNGSSIGSIAFSTSGTPTFTFASAVTFGAGDILTAVCPASPDVTGADIAFTLWGALN